MMSVDPGRVLQACATRQLAVLSEQTGVSVPRLAMLALKLADDPQMASEHPRWARIVREQRDRQREEWSARGLTVTSTI